jgi:hypothetical protein
MIHLTLCVILTLFFAWMLMHAFLYSNSKHQYRIIEGLDPSAPTTESTPAPTTESTTAPTQTQIDENTAEIAIIKSQIASLIDTATQLNTTMTQNETGVKNNTDLIQKVVKSQNDMQTKLANMKSAQ